MRRFGTVTAELYALAEWLQELQVTHVAMGIHWCLLETSMERAGGPIHAGVGERATR
jgi:hypothetical protein